MSDKLTITFHPDFGINPIEVAKNRLIHFHTDTKKYYYSVEMRAGQVDITIGSHYMVMKTDDGYEVVRTDDYEFVPGRWVKKGASEPPVSDFPKPNNTTVRLDVDDPWDDLHTY